MRDERKRVLDKSMANGVCTTSGTVMVQIPELEIQKNKSTSLLHHWQVICIKVCEENAWGHGSWRGLMPRRRHSPSPPFAQSLERENEREGERGRQYEAKNTAWQAGRLHRQDSLMERRREQRGKEGREAYSNSDIRQFPLMMEVIPIQASVSLLAR